MQPKTSDCIRVFKYVSDEPYYLHIYCAPEDLGQVRVVKNSNIFYRFFLMPPLKPPKSKYEIPLCGYNLSFCPSCGENLYIFYAKNRNIEEYVNEIEGETF